MACGTGRVGSSNSSTRPGGNSGSQSPNEGGSRASTPPMQSLAQANLRIRMGKPVVGADDGDKPKLIQVDTIDNLKKGDNKIYK